MTTQKGSKRDGKNRRGLSDSTKVEIRRIDARADMVTKLGHSVAKYGSAAIIAFFAYRAVDTLAGVDTFADITVSWLVSCKMTGFAALILALAALLYGHYQRKLRKDVIERMHRYQAAYERERDPNRTSSKLTPRGDTRKEDL